jgi:hypothetical protein
MNRVATPAVASAPQRWKPSCSETNATPWKLSTAAAKAIAAPPATAALVATSPAA